MADPLTLDNRVLNAPTNILPKVIDVPNVPPSLRPKPKDVPSDDELAVLSPKEAANFYRRLSESIRGKNPQSLAASMLLHWLDGKGEKLTIEPTSVKDSKFVIDYLVNEVRPVFLTDEKAKVSSGDKWGGILPRIKGIPPHPVWDGKSKFKIFYEGPPVEIPLSVHAKAFFGQADPAELDLLMSLHKFGLRTEVVMSASPIPNSTNYHVVFESWESWIFDRYDWDPTKRLKVPNPDYQDPLGVAPDKKIITVYHANAKRVEQQVLLSHMMSSLNGGE